jgi:hypothetical protein
MLTDRDGHDESFWGLQPVPHLLEGQPSVISGASAVVPMMSRAALRNATAATQHTRHHTNDPPELAA